ncbi:MAG TPA: HAMP domain-containing sensor histidine kinase [Chitinophagaceae bacterium]|nr:HAMP domain-containing sensor histidine kinase [Chitinophagaceae bacterium]
MRSFWKDTIYKNAYFLIGAAWLFTLSFIFSNYWSYTSSPKGVKKNLENYLAKNENDFFGVLSDTTLLLRLLNANESEKQVNVLTEKGYGIFIYKLEDYGPIDLKFWNTQESLPTDEMLARSDGEYLVGLPNGQYELIRRKLLLRGRQNILAFALIPVRRDFYLQNDYLQNGFVDHPNVEKNYTISSRETGYPVKNSLGKVLYYLGAKGDGRTITNDWITILLRILGSLCFLFYLNAISLAVSKRYGAGWGIGFLAAGIFVLRGLTYYVSIPFDFRQFELFSPSVYGYNYILKSLGDLLINALLFFWLAVFARRQINAQDIRINLKNKPARIIVAAVLMSLLVLLTMISGNIIRSLVADSQIPFDVTNFFSLNLYSVFGFIVLCSVCMAFFISSQVILRFVDSLAEATFLFKMLVVVVSGLLYLTTQINNLFDFQMSVIVWLLIYLAISQNKMLKGIYYISGTAMVYWLVIFSASITLVISSQNRKKEREIRRRVAEKLAWQADPSSEKLLNVAIGSLNNYFWQENLNRLRNADESEHLKDSIINANFSGYLNRYETEFYVFDENGDPLSGYEHFNYDTLATIYTMQGKRTGINNLRYYETAFDRFSYIYQREVKDTSNATVAYVYMLSNPRRYRSEAMIPELFKQSEDYSFERSPLYAYAVYNQGELITNVNDYPFPRSLNSDEVSFSEYEFRNRNGYSELWYKQGGDRIVVITRKTNILLEAITLFAYLFCAFLFLVGCFQLTSLLMRSGFRWSAFRELWQLNIRKQIFTTIIFISLFSFFIIGAATIFFFINRYNKNNQDRLSRTIHVISNEINNRIDVSQMNQQGFQRLDSSGNDNLANSIADISEIHNVDVNLYNGQGSLTVSSQPLVYNKGILSRMMDPVAFYNMKTLRKIQHVQDEEAGTLKYLSIYVPLKDENRNVQGYINIPYFTSSRDLNQEISNFLVTLLSLNAFIFLISGVISVFLTNRITSSFSWIGEKMREINLGKHNEEITWNRKDEIGGLVAEYNKMVKKLEQSAVDMAKTEREGAWREMARQVAHEIKNPLTPMKLSIQYLQKAIDNNAPNVKELSSSVASTLIEQIEHLSKIASEFSQFANIGNARSEIFDLHETIHSLVLLHSSQDHAIIEWKPMARKLMIKADRTQINRLLTNLLQNAVEAIPEEVKGQIIVSEEVRDEEVILSVQDNGSGIPQEMESKIFSPNFTTKTSGTGLGLAMCKSIVENSKGRIWFDTRAGEGTTFHVALPLED